MKKVHVFESIAIDISEFIQSLFLYKYKYLHLQTVPLFGLAVGFACVP